tara:strand:+ start:780 stop:1661 length:882 start_codon:yes stop_codon:yes gene_type:complete
MVMNFFIKIIILTLVIFQSPAIADYCAEGDCENGFGTYIYDELQITYTGENKDNKADGFGQMELPGRTYIGQFKNDMMHGFGKYIFNTGEYSGDVYIGNFKDDNFHGYGMYLYADGTIHYGEWENDEFLEDSSANKFVDEVDHIKSSQYAMDYVLDQNKRWTNFGGKIGGCESQVRQSFSKTYPNGIRQWAVNGSITLDTLPEGAKVEFENIDENQFLIQRNMPLTDFAKQMLGINDPGYVEGAITQYLITLISSDEIEMHVYTEGIDANLLFDGIYEWGVIDDNVYRETLCN